MSTWLKRSLAAAGVLLMCSGALAACGSPSPSPTPEPTPEPTPDIAQVFVARLASPGFQAVTEVTGTMTLGPVEGTIEGEYLFSRGDYSSSLLIDIAGITQQQDEVAVDGDRFTSSNGGPWIRAEAPEPGAQDETLTELLTGVQSLEDGGEVQKFGRTLRQLVSADPVQLDAASLGLSDPTITGLAGTMEFFAEPDGTPAGFSIQVSWTQELEPGTTVDAEMVVDYEFTDLEGPVEIEAPEAVYLIYASSEWSYQVAYPEEWEATSDPTSEIFRPSGIPTYFLVTHVDLLPELQSQAAFEADSQAGFASFGDELLDIARYPVSGEDGQLAIYRATTDDGPWIVLNIAVYHKGVGWDIGVGSPEFEGAIETLANNLDWVMPTFAFTE